MLFQDRVWLFYGQNTKRPSEEKNKNPNNLKVTVLKRISKILLPDKFSENRFFLSFKGIGDRYSKSLLSTFETTKWANKREYENFVSVALKELFRELTDNPTGLRDERE